MGSKITRLSEDKFDEYSELTYLSRKEIIRAYDKFKSCDPIEFSNNLDVRFAREKIMMLPELRVNPFAKRICDVFSSEKDGKISFEDFLDMMSCFCERASRDVKVDYAFRIFDLNDDDYISPEDMKLIISKLISPHELPEEHLQCIIGNILIESDMDNDGQLSFAEFQHLISKSPDFFK
ncbi:hypothetical protein HELRODRAFT_77588 [Helobdella robusta]|uniref:EF-hand domain-containing protein n=1 Tax=Helobdella robusta TaxID=6412 RepID=T1G303_HELRO|nr:hypothetical protein HELRODRAFT_77588 [Helobdella robusta]ESO05745.1 hypothetical protein HELRODRAFT_77588 [Helobdella robusta]